MPVFKGSGVAIVTPFKVDYSIDYDRLADLVEFQINGGSDAIIICGTTGEASTLTHEEHIEAIRFTVSRVAGRVPVIAGSGSNCTDTAIYLSEEAEKAGADALMVVTPYYNKATQRGLITHFRAIASSTKLPIILYNVPVRTNLNIQAETFAALVNDVPNIVGVKEASGNFTQIAMMMHLTDGKAELYSGNDDHIVPVLSLGGIGVISVLANIAPRKTHDICHQYFSGDFGGSLRLQLESMPLIDALFCEVNPIPIKRALRLMGKDSGVLRRPLTEMEPANAAKLEKILYDMGFIN
ncbi:MAG: 4-hydroxy-tetrahydrodipicolinate synthase [Lachnospiraceae bacterium]|jgi:4-hydroxy-tetrahydrodipicolinate synthase|nr:4-hydroxy-tetrahydrodipicolinate synthase [Lachnospiraceae bacterium]